jgi:hypothetical protein
MIGSIAVRSVAVTAAIDAAARMGEQARIDALLGHGFEEGYGSKDR